MTNMKGFAEFHVRTWPPWDRTAIRFMINSFLELASKTTVSFVFALSNIRSVTFPSVMRIWSPKYKTKLQSQSVWVCYLRSCFWTVFFLGQGYFRYLCPQSRYTYSKYFKYMISSKSIENSNAYFWGFFLFVLICSQTEKRHHLSKAFFWADNPSYFCA